MAKQKKGEGFHSAAGLIRYFDSEEDTALSIPAWLVILSCVGLVVAVELLKYLKPY